MTLYDEALSLTQKLSLEDKQRLMAQLRVAIKQETAATPSSDDVDPIEAFIGAFDDDVTDLSVTVRQTLMQKFG